MNAEVPLEEALLAELEGQIVIMEQRIKRLREVVYAKNRRSTYR